MRKLIMLRSLLLALVLALPSAAWAQDESGDDGVVQGSEDKKKDVKKPKRLAPRSAVAQPDPRVVDSLKPSKSSSKTDDTPANKKETGEEVDEPWQGDADSTANTGVEDPGKSTKPPIQPLPTDIRVNLDYDNVDIKDVIKDFSRKTGRNFLIDPKISGKITVHAPLAVPMEDAYEVFIAILDANNYATVVEANYKTDDPDYRRLGLSKPRWKRGDPLITRILPAGDAKSEPLQIYKGNYLPRTSGLVTRLVTLDNISADEVSKVIQKWVSSAGDLISYAPTNTLIITDSANNISRMMDLISELDISAPKQKLEVVQIQFAEATRVIEIIREIYGEDGTAQQKTTSSTSKASSRRNRNKGKSKAKAGTPASSTSVGASTSFISKMIADERTNSILILATEKSLVEIRDLIARIDYETDPFAQSDIHVMYLEHQKAEELSQTLNNLTQQSNQRNQQGNRNTRGNNRNAGNNERNASRAANNRSGQAGNLGGNFQNEVRITHDVPTNALVVTASRDDFNRLRKVVDLLDIPRKQVFVETVIMEVSDSRSNDNGISWHGGGGGANQLGPVSILGARGSQSISPATSLLDGSLLAGLGLGIFGQALNIPVPGVDGGLEIPAFGVVMRFLQEDTGTNVLSSPNILTLDNEEATIEIGETIPFPTGGALAGLAGGLGGAAGGFGGIPTVSFTREDVGIILRITPQINDGDFVTMDIYQEISEVQEGSTADTLATGGPTTTKRSAETAVSVKSNQTVVIGGLMQEVETENESKVPVLGDIPLIGALFRNKRKTKRKTNLLIFLTPHVIDGPEDLYEVYRIKMLQREEFMRRFYGKTSDEQLNELNELIRYSMNLPDQPSVYRDQTSRREDVMIRFDETEGVELDEAIDEIDSEDDAVLITPEGDLVIPADEGDDLPEDGEEGDDGTEGGSDEATEEDVEPPFEAGGN
jgi:general secretion pathway protein D